MRILFVCLILVPCGIGLQTLLASSFEITFMSKTLIIAEKPSVANDIAKTLGGFTKHDEYFESDEYVLSSAVGHLLEIAVPEEYDVKRGKWTFTHLPMIPPNTPRVAPRPAREASRSL